MRYRAEISATRISDAIDLGSAHGEPGDYMVVRDGGGEVVFLTPEVFEGIFEATGNGKPRNGRKAREPKSAEAEDELGKRGWKGRLVVKGLQSPKSAGELLAWLEKNGWPECTSVTLNARLQDLKRNGRVELRDEGTWSACG
jgi:hypothetical protein